VEVELVNSRNETGGRGTLDRPLIANEAGTVAVFTPPADRYSGPYRIFVSWIDGRGRQRRVSSVEVGKPQRLGVAQNLRSCRLRARR
jgi:hypothetical protein